MNKGVFIVGTDTDIGKTFVSALILKKLRVDGINAGYFKAVLSGAELEGGELIPGDCKFVCETSGLFKDYKSMVSYTLENPYSPHLASEIENVDISLEKIMDDYNKIKSKFDFILCEGSGGIICPISFGKEKIMLEDIVREINLPIIIVARAGLGTINHTFLTVNYLKNAGFDIKGIVLNNFEENNIIHIDNKKTIESLTGINNIITVKYSDNINEIELDNIGRLIYE